MYKKAAQLGLRIPTAKGNLSVEQLFTLNLSELNVTAVALNEKIEKLPSKSFLETSKKEDEVLKLQFDIALDVLNTKKALQEELLLRKTKKAKNEKILALMAEKEDSNLKNLSLEELKAMLEE